MTDVIFNGKERFKHFILTAVIPSLLILGLVAVIEHITNISLSFEFYQRVCIMGIILSTMCFSFGMGWAGGEGNTVEKLKLKEGDLNGKRS